MTQDKSDIILAVALRQVRNVIIRRKRQREAGAAPPMTTARKASAPNMSSADACDACDQRNDCGNWAIVIRGRQCGRMCLAQFCATHRNEDSLTTDTKEASVRPASYRAWKRGRGNSFSSGH